jgi:TfoX/Sxy family transcriptional regulator of competence genes
MAKEYFEKLTNMVSELSIAEEVALPMEVKHFFSGAALYINGTLAVSWSPVGLAFKLSEQEAEALITKGEAKPLKYFAKGHVKKGYALFENPEQAKLSKWKTYFLKAAKRV